MIITGAAKAAQSAYQEAVSLKRYGEASEVANLPYGILPS